MKPLGGFFGLEQFGSYRNEFLHEEALALCSGRSCLSYILDELKPSHVYVPFYTCNALLSPLLSRGISYDFYPIDNLLNPLFDKELQPNEYLIYINYFGLKSSIIDGLFAKYGVRLIVDNTQAFFERPIASCISFNSARKFFGVPDGAFLYGFNKGRCGLPENVDISFDHLINRNLGLLETAYKQFQEYEKRFNCDIKRISSLSSNILHSIDYNQIADLRLTHFYIYEHELGPSNNLKIDYDTQSIPFCYPFFHHHPISRAFMHNSMIFIPTFWDDIFNRDCQGYMFEKIIARRLLPLPVDHRLTISDVKRVIETIKSCLSI